MNNKHNERRKLAWEVFKWIQKNDPYLSNSENRGLYFIVKKIVIDFHMKMSFQPNVSEKEIEVALKQLARAESGYKRNKFKLTEEIVKRFLIESDPN